MNHTLTIDIANIIGPSDNLPTVYLYSVRVGSGFTNRMFGPVRKLDPGTGNIVVENVPASSSYDYKQQYIALIGATKVYFTMPNRDADLATLIEQRAQIGRVAVGDNPPPNPAPGDLWWDTSETPTVLKIWDTSQSPSVWALAGGGGGGGSASIPDGSLDLDKLTSSAQDRINKSVKWADDAGSEQPSISGRDINFLAVDETGSTTVTVPGITIESGGQVQGTANEPHTIDFVGDGVTAAVTATKATVTIPGYDATAIEGRVAQIEEFEETFRVRTALATNARVVTTMRNIGYALGNTVALPDDSSDAHLLITIRTAGEDAIEEEFELSEIYAKVAVVVDGQAISSTNAVVITRGTDSYYIGRDTSGDLFFGTSEAGITYFVDAAVTSLDAYPFVRDTLEEGTNVTITPNNTTRKISIAASGGGGGGLTVEQVKAEIKSYAQADNATDLVSRADLDQNQRLPAPTANEWMKWNSAGDAIENVTAPVSPASWAEDGTTEDVPIDNSPSASSSQGGVISENDYNKLSGIETGATAENRR